jgi:hypothetical protein
VTIESLLAEITRALERCAADEPVEEAPTLNPGPGRVRPERAVGTPGPHGAAAAAGAG